MAEGEKSSYLKALHPSHRPSPPPTLDLTPAVPDAASLPVLLLTKSEGDAGGGRGEGCGGGREGVEGVEDATEEREGVEDEAVESAREREGGCDGVV
jgi:hypothetical protein